MYDIHIVLELCKLTCYRPRCNLTSARLGVILFEQWDRWMLITSGETRASCSEWIQYKSSTQIHNAYEYEHANTMPVRVQWMRASWSCLRVSCINECTHCISLTMNRHRENRAYANMRNALPRGKEPLERSHELCKQAVFPSHAHWENNVTFYLRRFTKASSFD